MYRLLPRGAINIGAEGVEGRGKLPVISIAVSGIT